jgi:hypothetical protein
MTAMWFFFSSASFPIEPLDKKGHSLSKSKKVEKLERRLEKVSNPEKKARIKEKIKKITYGEQGDALGLAALISGIISILLSIAVLAFLGIELQLLVFIGLLLGAAAIIIGIVDLRYTDMPGQAYAAIVAGGLGLIAAIIALIFVK